MLVLEALALCYLFTATDQLFAGTSNLSGAIERVMALGAASRVLIGVLFFLTLVVDVLWRIAELVGWEVDAAAYQQHERPQTEKRLLSDAPPPERLDTDRSYNQHHHVVEPEYRRSVGIGAAPGSAADSVYRRYIWSVSVVLLAVVGFVGIAATLPPLRHFDGWPTDLAAASIVGISIVLGALVVSSFLLLIARANAMTTMQRELMDLDRTIERADETAERIRRFRRRRKQQVLNLE